MQNFGGRMLALVFQMLVVFYIVSQKDFVG